MATNFAISPQLAADLTASGTPTTYDTAHFNATYNTASLILASFGNTSNTGAFSDTYYFRVPVDGTGSGNLSTSFFGSAAAISISDIIINGVSYASSIGATPSGQTFSIADLPITGPIGNGQFFVNKIQIVGNVTGVQGAYQGGLSFGASPVPETATWAMMLVGFGAIGAACRSQRRSVKVRFS